MATPPQRRLPFAPIEDRMRDPEMSDAAFADHLGITRKSLKLYRNVGLRYFKADQFSCKLGFHPTYFWGDDWFGPIYEEIDTQEEVESLS